MPPICQSLKLQPSLYISELLLSMQFPPYHDMIAFFLAFNKKFHTMSNVGDHNYMQLIFLKLMCCILKRLITSI